VAITELARGTLTSIANPTTLASSAVAKPAGTNRLLLVAIHTRQVNGDTSETQPSATYGGVALSPLTRSNDGVTGAFITAKAVSFASRVGVHWLMMREAELAPLGATPNLDVTFAPPGTLWYMRAAYWFLNNCDQGAQVRQFFRASTTGDATTVIGGTMNTGGVSDAVLVAASNLTNTGSIQITVNAVGLTEDYDLQLVAPGRNAGAKSLPGGALSVPFDATFSVTGTPGLNAAVTVAVRLAEFFPVNPGNAVIYGGPATAVSLEAS